MSTNKPSQNPLNRQAGGTHYTRLDYQPIEFSVDNNLDPCAAFITKHLARLGEKGSKVLELEKVLHYLELRQSFSYQPWTQGLRVPMARLAEQPNITHEQRDLLYSFSIYLTNHGQAHIFRADLQHALATAKQEESVWKKTKAVADNAEKKNQ